jgi:benzoate membrane transport protein
VAAPSWRPCIWNWRSRSSSPALQHRHVLQLTVPLVLVSLTGQFLPGMAVLPAGGLPSAHARRGHRHRLASLVTACFGGITIVLAAITAALCTGKDAHPEPGRRQPVLPMASSISSAAPLALHRDAVAAFPKELIAALAGWH